MAHDPVRNLWECDDCGTRFQAQPHLVRHQLACDQYIGSQAERARPLPPLPEPVPSEDDAQPKKKKKE